MGSMEFLVDITDIALPTDYGVARKDGRVIFVPGAVIGDRVKVALARQQRQFRTENSQISKRPRLSG